MQFTTPTFLLFFAVFYLFYIVFHRWLWLQNLWLLLASYVFFSLFGLRFLLVLLFITLSDFCLGWFLGRMDIKNQQLGVIRKILIVTSVIIDVGLLALFKYYDFFAADFARVLKIVGIHADQATLEFLVPIGISFYALKSLSYTLDIYRGRQVPTSNLLEYGIFIAFFPTLLAGPIDRASRLLPQIHQSRYITSNHLAAGLSLILWGYFKKLVIADNLALISNQVFQVGGDAFGLDILFGVAAFSVQIYADFSGYSDIARGLAHMMGFELAVNFNLPYFALNPADFWQRWHISLSEWLRDYIFFPLRRMILSSNIRDKAWLGLLIPPFITMLISGLWHGTGWNFILWGLYHGGLLVAYRWVADRPKQKNIIDFGNSPLGIVFRISLMFGFVSLGWLFFRAESVSQAFQMLANLSLESSNQSLSFVNDLLFFSLPLFLVQVWQALKGDLLVLFKQRFAVQVFINSLLLVWMIVFSSRQVSEFIYSQF